MRFLLLFRFFVSFETSMSVGGSTCTRYFGGNGDRPDNLLALQNFIFCCRHDPDCATRVNDGTWLCPCKAPFSSPSASFHLLVLFVSDYQWQWAPIIIHVFFVIHGDRLVWSMGGNFIVTGSGGRHRVLGKVRLPPTEAFPTLSDTSMMPTESLKASGLAIHIIPDLKVRQGRQLGTLVCCLPSSLLRGRCDSCSFIETLNLNHKGDNLRSGIYFHNVNVDVKFVLTPYDNNITFSLITHDHSRESQEKCTLSLSLWLN